MNEVGVAVSLFLMVMVDGWPGRRIGALSLMEY
jgi:hypothetical protein